MLDVGWTELLVIGALALIVVGPRDLPRLLRTVGQTVGKIKRMAREFQRSLEDAARDTDLANLRELRDLKKEMGGLDFRQQAAKAQSYMNQPVTPGKGKAKGGEAKGGAAAGTADAGATPDREKTPETKTAPETKAAPETEPATTAAGTRAPGPSSAPAGSDEPRPSAPEGAAPASDPSEPRRAGARG